MGPLAELDFTFGFLNPWLLLSLVVLLPLVVVTGMRSLYSGTLPGKLAGIVLRLGLIVVLLISLAVLLLVHDEPQPLVAWLPALLGVTTLLVLDVALLGWVTSDAGDYTNHATFRVCVVALPVLLAVLLGVLVVGEALFDPWVLTLLGSIGLLTYLTARLRQSTSVALRLCIVALLVAAAAEMQLVRLNDRLTVLFLLDQSLSVREDWRANSLEYVRSAIREKDRPREDRVGVIAFARDSGIEIPPLDYEVSFRGVEGMLRRENTDIAGAIKLAQAAFQEDSARRIVLLSDGNENLGNAMEEARMAAESGIGIDVVPLLYRYEREVLVEKIQTPSDAQQGETVKIRVVLSSTHPATGTLHLFQRSRNRELPLAMPLHVELKPEPDKNVFERSLQINEPGSYDFRARFVPDDPADDVIAQNNVAADFIFVQGEARVLIVEQEQRQGEHDELADQLRREKIEVDQIPASELPTSLGDLQPYDSIILANVPKEDLSDRQIQMLATNTHDMGCGLVMLGGPDSFGAGGWRDTPVEEALPVDMKIKSPKVMPKGALVLIMHASEMARGNYWQKVIAKDAIRALSDSDYAGLLHWNGTDAWLWGGGLLPVGENRNRMLGRVSSMTPGDMPAFDPSLRKARNALWKRTDAAIKHIIVISDGDPSAPTNTLVKSLQDTRPGRKISVSTVAVASHGVMDLNTMRNLARATGGRFYNVKNPRALPKIFQKEARVVSRPLIYEREEGFRPVLRYQSEPLIGVSADFPPITGFVMTTPKESTLVQVPLVSPLPGGGQINPLMAHWTYGLGKSVAFTTDAGPGPRWTTGWSAWPDYAKLVSQMVRWSMRSLERGNFRVSTVREDDKVRIVVDALNKDDEFLNFLTFAGVVVGPDMKDRPLKLDQTAPGRYEGVFEVSQQGGSSFFSLTYQGPDGVEGVLLGGVSVPYSPEFREMQANRGLLEQLAALTPKGGQPGRVIEGNSINDWLQADIFRHDLARATAAEDIWQWLVGIAGVLFFFDVFVRRVAVSFAWAMPAAAIAVNYVRGRPSELASQEYLDRLRSRKEEVSRQLQRRQAAQRFEPEADAPVEPGVLQETAQGPSARPAKPAEKPSVVPEEEQEGYTSRLLKAKKKVWEERD